MWRRIVAGSETEEIEESEDSTAFGPVKLAVQPLFAERRYSAQSTIVTRVRRKWPYSSNSLVAPAPL